MKPYKKPIISTIDLNGSFVLKLDIDWPDWKLSKWGPRPVLSTPLVA